MYNRLVALEKIQANETFSLDSHKVFFLNQCDVITNSMILVNKTIW